MKLIKLLLILTISVSLIDIAGAQTIRLGRSAGTAGSSTMSMYGATAAGWNPANLGIRANPAASVLIPSFGMSLGNNAFSPQFISDTFVEGDTLDQAQKEEILSTMDADQLRIYGLFGVPVFGLSISRYAMNANAHVLATAAIPADIFELMLTGPVSGTSYDLSTVDVNTIGYVAASVSAAHPLSPLPFTQEFAVGATFKYLVGGAMAQLEHKEGLIYVDNQTLRAQGLYRFVNSSSGDGVGLDLAAAGQLDFRDIYVGVTFGNLIGSINWTEVEANEVQFSRDDGLSVDSLTKAQYWNTFLSSTDSTYDFGDIETELPKYILIGADMPYMSGRGDLFVSYYQGLNETVGQNTTPRISVGTEFRWIPIFPLRAGVAFGGIEGSEFSAGFGLKLLGYHLNFGTSWQRGLAGSAEGFSIAITNYFGPSFTR